MCRLKWYSELRVEGNSAAFKVLHVNGIIHVTKRIDVFRHDLDFEMMARRLVGRFIVRALAHVLALVPVWVPRCGSAHDVQCVLWSSGESGPYPLRSVQGAQSMRENGVPQHFRTLNV